MFLLQTKPNTVTRYYTTATAGRARYRTPGGSVHQVREPCGNVMIALMPPKSGELLALIGPGTQEQAGTGTSGPPKNWDESEESRVRLGQVLGRGDRKTGERVWHHTGVDIPRPLESLDGDDGTFHPFQRLKTGRTVPARRDDARLQHVTNCVPG